MDNTTAPAPRCDHRADHGLGCARSLGHDGAHWLTASAEAARSDLLRIGFFAADAVPTSPFTRRALAGALPAKAVR